MLLTSTSLYAQDPKDDISDVFLEMSTGLDDSLGIVKDLYLQESILASGTNSKYVDRLSHLFKGNFVNLNRRDSIVLGQGLHNIGRKYKAYQLRARALEIYKQTLAIRREVLSADDKNLSHTLDNMGDLLIDNNELDSAYSCITEAMLIRERLKPEQVTLKASSYTKMAKLYNTSLDHNTALYYTEKANSAYKKVLPNEHPKMVESMVNLVTVLLDLGEFARTEQYARLIDNSFETIQREI